MNRVSTLAVTVWRLFVADRALAGFVVCWAALCWCAGGRAAALLAVGPIVALWVSVCRAAGKLRREKGLLS